MPNTGKHDVSAVLLNWRRPWNLPKIVESLRRYDFIKEILVWNNHVGPPAQEPDIASLPGSVRVYGHNENLGTYGRFTAASVARCPAIYTQDDDYIVNNIPELYERFCEFDDQVVHALSPNHYRIEAGRTSWAQLGWGSFFAKSSIGLLHPYIDRYGIDTLLKSKADRIFTILHGKHLPLHADFEVLRNPDGGPSDRDCNSLWLQKDHLRLRDMAAVRALELKRELVK